jgi:hypothetical protein
MPGNFNKPSMNDFGKYLESILGPEYGVSYIERKTPRGQTLPDASFFHITHTRGSETISENLNIKLPAQSNFTTNYGDPNAVPQQEWAPQLMTRRGDYGYVFAGTLERTHQPGANIGNRPRTAKDPFSIQQVLRGPTASFAAAVSTAFETVREERAQGNVNANVQSHLFNIAAEGSDESADINVAAGTTLVSTRSAPSLTQNAAKAIQLANNFEDERVAGISRMEQTRRMNEWTYNTIQTGAPIYTQSPPGQPGYQSNLSTSMRDLGYAQDRSMSGGVLRRLREYFHYASQPGFLPTSSISKHLNLIEGRETVEPLGLDMQPLASTVIPQTGFTADYRKLNATLGGRIPERGFVGTTIYTTQEALQPGGGTLYPENLGRKIGTMGFRKTLSYPVSSNIEGLIQGDVGISVPHKAGERIESSTEWTFAKISTRRALNQAGQLESVPEVPLEERMGGQDVILGGHELVIPKYRNAYSGIGESYDPNRLSSGEIIEVTNKEIAALQKRLGFAVRSNETVNQAFLEYPNSFVDVGTKWAGAGEKIGLAEQPGTPVIDIGLKKGLPVLTSSMEVKALPEKMITSLAALNSSRQEKLLSEYAESLRVSESRATGEEARILGDQYQGVTTAITETKAARAQNPEARLDIDRMASNMGIAAHDVGRDILQRIFLGGRSLTPVPGQTQPAFTQMSETELNAEANTEWNLRNLRRYGTGLVSTDRAPLIHRTYEESEYQTLLAPYSLAATDPEMSRTKMGLKSPMSAAEAETAFQKQYGFAAQSANGQRARDYRIPGLAVTGYSLAGAEWKGGGTANAELASLITAKAPDYAAALGLSTLDLGQAGNLSRALEAQKIHEISNPPRWGNAQLASLTMINKARGTSGFEIPESTMITEQMAQEMSSDVGLQMTLGRGGANLAGLSAFQAKLQEYFPDVDPDTLKTRPISFEAAPGYYLPSTHAIRTQSEEDYTTMGDVTGTGEDKTRTWEMYQNALRQGIQGSTYHDPDAVTIGGNKLYNYLSNRFGLTEGVKTEGVKSLFGSNVPITNARYTYSESLKQNEVYVPGVLGKAMIRHGLKSLGLEATRKEVNQVWNMYQGKNSKLIEAPNVIKEYFKESGAPIAGGRWPVLEGKGSIFFGNLVTSSHLSRRGSPVPFLSGLTNNMFRIGSGLSAMLGGDLDLDQLWAALGITSAKRQDGKLALQFGAFDQAGQLRQTVASNIQEISGVPYRKYIQELFPAGMSEEFDPLLKNVLSTGQGGMAAVAKLMGTQYDKAGTYPYEMLKESLQTWSGSKLMMGSTYNYTRAREAQQAITGWSTDEIMQARRTRAQLYQPFLDITSRKATPLVEMYQKSFLSEGANGNLGMGWGLTNDKDDIFWTSKAAQNNTLNQQGIMNTLRNMLGTAIQTNVRGGKEELPTPELIASDFAPEGSRAFIGEGGRNPLDVDMWGKISTARAAGQRDLEMERQYYEQVSLQEALTGPYQGGGTMAERAKGMRTAAMDWYKANYIENGQNSMKLFDVPILGAMFGKAVASKVDKEPGWTPPDAFTQTPEGQRLMMNAALQQPLFNMMKGKLFPADVAMKFMRGAQNLGAGVNNTLTWGLGNIQNILGFGKMKLTSELGTLYEQVGDTAELRGHEIPALAGVGVKYKTKSGMSYRDESLFRSNVYSVGNLLGYQNPFKLTNMLLPSDTNQYLQAGTLMEAKLGAIMGEKAGWKSVNPMRFNQSTGQLENMEASDPRFPWSSPFTWEGKLGNTNVRVNATEDFIHNVREPGKPSFTQIDELKYINKGITREQIIKERLPAALLQSRVAPWTIEENLKEVAQGGDIGARAADRIHYSLRSRFDTDAEYLETQENLLAGRFGSRPTFVQEGSELALEIEKGASADPARIQALIEEQHQPGYWGEGVNTSYVSNVAEHNALTGTLTKAAEDVVASRPRMLSKMWDIASNAPAYWQRRVKELQAAGAPAGVANARAMLDTANTAYKSLRSIGVGAQNEIAQQLQNTGVGPIQSGATSVFGGMPVMPPMPGATGTTGSTTQTPLSQQATIPVQPPTATTPAWNPNNAPTPTPAIKQAAFAAQQYAAMAASYSMTAQNNYPNSSVMATKLGSMAQTLRDRSAQEQAKVNAFYASFASGQGGAPTVTTGPAAAAAAGAGTPAGAGATTVNPLSPTGGGEVDPTARAARFLQQYNEFFPSSGAGGFYDTNQRLMQKLSTMSIAKGGAALTSTQEAHAFLGTLSTAEIKGQLSEFQGEATKAHELQRLANQVTGDIKANTKINYSLLGPQGGQLATLTKDVQDTTTAQGGAELPLVTIGNAFEVGKKGAGKAPVAPMTPELTAHFEKLAQTTQKVVDNFDALSKGTKSLGDVMKENQDYMKDMAKENLAIKTGEAAQPLLAAGVLQRDATTGALSMVSGAPALADQKIRAQLQKYDEARMEEAAIGEPEPTGIARFGGLARKALGGWGMMFAGRMFGLAAGGTTFGAAEAQKMEGIFGQGAAVSTGYAYMPYNQAQRIENLKGLYGQAYQGIPALQSWAQTTPGVSDVYNTAVAGLGGFGYAAWMGSISPEGKNSWLSKNATGIGIALAAASVLGTGINKSKNPEGIGLRYYNADQGDVWDRLGQVVNFTDTIGYMISKEETDLARSQYTNIGLMMEAGYTPNEIAQGMGYKWNRSGGGGLFAATQFTQGAPSRAEGAKSQVMAMQLVQQENLALAPEAITKAWQLAAGTNISTADNKIGEIAAYIQQTGLTPDVLQSILQSTGTGLGQQYGGGKLGVAFQQAMGTVGPAETQYLQAGAGVLQQMGPAAAYMGYQGAEQYYAQVLGQYAGTPEMGVFMNQVQQWQTGKTFGWNVQRPSESMLTRTLTQEELGIEALRAQNTGAREELTSQIGALAMNYLGRTAPEAQDLQGTLEDKTVGELQKMLDEYTSLAKSVAMQRSVVPGKTEQYYQDYRAQMEALKPAERLVEQNKQDQLLAIKEMYLGAGLNEGYVTPMMGYMQDTRSPAEVERYAKRAQWATRTAEGFATSWGLNEQQRVTALSQFDQYAASGFAQLGTGITPFNDWYQNMQSGIQQFEPYALTQGVAYGANIAGTQTAIPGWMASRDIWGPNAPLGLEGMPLNAPAFTVSGASHPLFGMLQQNLGSAMNWSGGVGQAFSQGYQVPGTNFTMAGLQGAQNYLMVQQAQNQAAYAGNSMAQLNLAMTYTPQMWAIQDQMTQLGYEQQRWGFQRQEQGLQLQQQQASAQWGLQATQMGLQRQWARQDWGTQDQQRAQQWGWQVEDFQENVRFMTGRDRRLAERQMARTTITHDQEGEQIDKNRKRQEEMWALEDMRFDLQKQQFMENQQFQQEGIDQQREFFEQRVLLETQLRDLQREYQREQWELQKQMVGIQAKQAQDAADYAKLQAGISATMLEQQTMTEDIQKNGVTFVELWDAKLREWITAMGGTPGGGGGGNEDHSDEWWCDVCQDWFPNSGRQHHVHRSALGDVDVSSGETMVVGERGRAEYFTPSTHGKVTTYMPWESTNLSKGSSPSKREREPDLIIVNIGNEELKRYIVRAVGEEL